MRREPSVGVRRREKYAEVVLELHERTTVVHDVILML